MSALKTERRGNETVLIGECCGKPSLTITEQGIVVQPKHSTGKCRDFISWDEIEKLKRQAKNPNTTLYP